MTSFPESEWCCIYFTLLTIKRRAGRTLVADCFREGSSVPRHFSAALNEWTTPQSDRNKKASLAGGFFCYQTCGVAETRSAKLLTVGALCWCRWRPTARDRS